METRREASPTQVIKTQSPPPMPPQTIEGWKKEGLKWME